VHRRTRQTVRILVNTAYLIIDNVNLNSQANKKCLHSISSVVLLLFYIAVCAVTKIGLQNVGCGGGNTLPLTKPADNIVDDGLWQGSVAAACPNRLSVVIARFVPTEGRLGRSAYLIKNVTRFFSHASH
jgi:hypothetical protein